MAGQQDTLREQWRIAIIGAGGVGLSILLIEKFIIDPIARESVWVSIPVMAAIITVGIAMARYWLIMCSYAAAAKGSRERERADGLRERLEQGGGAGKIYEATLTRFLKAVDRFFGDADPTVKTLWPRAFGYHGQAPFWTAPAYDRCLTIALLYPLLAMLIIWTATGSVGPGERAMGLGANVEDWRRWVGLLLLAISWVSYYFLTKVRGLSLKIAFYLVTCAFAAAFASTVPSTLAIGLCFLIIFVGVFATGGAGTFSGTIVVAFSDYGNQGATGDPVGVYAAILVIFVLFFDSFARKRGRQDLFLFLHALIYLPFFYSVAKSYGTTAGWEVGGALLLFLGVLTLVNAPFDWLTIGLTRALLRRGLELRRWWPLALAGLDLVLAAVIIVLLAIAMLLAVQAFEYVGGTPILGVKKVLNDLADPEMRTHPEYWWLYATLFSTLIPSIINVAIGALSIMRGSGGFHRYVAAKMPAGQAMLLADALWAVPLLALEVLGSAVIGVALTLGWIWVVVAKLFPLFGGLIPMLRAVAGLA